MALLKSLPVFLFLLLRWPFGPFGAQPALKAPEPLEVPKAEASEERILSLMELIAKPLETDPSTLLTDGKEALALLVEHPDEESRLRVLSALCYASYRQDQHQAAIEYGLQAEELARTMGDSSELAFVLTYLGNSARRLGEHHRGLTFSLEAIGLYESLGDLTGVGKAANGVGYAYWRLGEYPKALTFYLRAQESFLAAQDPGGVGKTFSNIATLYVDVRRPRRALEFYQKAMAMQQEEGNERQVGRLHSDIASAYNLLGDPVRAMEHGLSSLEICRRLEDQHGAALALNEIGDTFRDQGQLEQAMDSYLQALKIRRQTGDRKRQAHTLNGMALVDMARGQHEAAVEHLREGLSIASEIRAKGEVLEAYEGLTKAYAALERYREAFEASRDQQRIEGELFNEKISRDFEEILARFEAGGGRQGEVQRRQTALDVRETELWRTILLASLASVGLLALFVLVRTRKGREASGLSENLPEAQSEVAEAGNLSQVPEPRSDETEAHREGVTAKLDPMKKYARVQFTGKGGSFILRWQSKSPVSSSFPLSPGKNRIGRDPGNDIVLPLPQISREHGCLVVEGGSFELVDLSSTNGTEVNGKVAKRCKLRVGDIICLGNTELLRLEVVDPQDAELGLVFGEPISSNGYTPPDQRSEEVTSTTIARPLADAFDALVFPENWVPGISATIHQLYQEMNQLLDADLTVLIEGETGVGKEGVSQILHLSSNRCEGPFVAVNCAAIPSELLEAEMFGIGKGVATGVSSRPGRFLSAQGGTLFLDEIGEMPLELQAKLLRAVQEKKIQPVGAAEIPVDVWVIAATNQDLLKLNEDGKFRRDLYYRLAGAVLKVPPLRERRDDVIPLLDHFLRCGAGDDSSRIRGVTVKVLNLFQHYSWRGNVREMEHEVKRLVHLSENDQIIDTAMLSERLLELEGKAPDQEQQEESLAAETSNTIPPLLPPSPAEEIVRRPASWRLKDHVQEIERQVILGALQEVGSSQRQASELLGISRSTLARKIAELEIQL